VEQGHDVPRQLIVADGNTADVSISNLRNPVSMSSAYFPLSALLTNHDVSVQVRPKLRKFPV
jgi:hypothetical protein